MLEVPVVAIYPNPASAYLEIEITQPATIEVTTLQGRLIKAMRLSSGRTSTDISFLPEGIYFLKVKTEQGIWIKKFIKE